MAAARLYWAETRHSVGGPSPQIPVRGKDEYDEDDVPPQATDTADSFPQPRLAIGDDEARCLVSTLSLKQITSNNFPEELCYSPFRWRTGTS
jgi:hypothetical protein